MNETAAIAALTSASKLQGPILDALIAFLSSPAGQAIIAALIKKLFGG